MQLEMHVCGSLMDVFDPEMHESSEIRSGLQDYVSSLFMTFTTPLLAKLRKAGQLPSSCVLSRSSIFCVLVFIVAESET